MEEFPISFTKLAILDKDLLDLLALLVFAQLTSLNNLIA